MDTSLSGKHVTMLEVCLTTDRKPVVKVAHARGPLVDLVHSPICTVHVETCTQDYVKLILCDLSIKLTKCIITPWLMEPVGSMPHSQGLANNSYPEPNQPNSPH